MTDRPTDRPTEHEACRPLAIDLYAGLGGWTEGLLDEGYRVIGFDREQHVYGEARYPAQLVVQDVLTLHGSQFRSAALIVASPPCQEYSYMAMPWSRAKQIAAEYRDGTRDVGQLTALFDACFRIQREASEAAGHHIPLVVENVCGAQQWVGRARWHYGSFYLWGDIPALMPITRRAAFKGGDRNVGRVNGTHEWNTGFDVNAKVGGFSWDDYGKPGYKARAFNGEAEKRLRATKNDGGSWFNVAHNTTSGTGQNPTHRQINQAWRNKKYEDAPKMKMAGDGVKQGGDWFNNSEPSISRQTASKSSARKAASAHIAKIPYELARHIGRAWKPAYEATA